MDVVKVNVCLLRSICGLCPIFYLLLWPRAVHAEGLFDWCVTCIMPQCLQTVLYSSASKFFSRMGAKNYFYHIVDSEEQGGSLHSPLFSGCCYMVNRNEAAARSRYVSTCYVDGSFIFISPQSSLMDGKEGKTDVFTDIWSLLVKERMKEIRRENDAVFQLYVLTSLCFLEFQSFIFLAPISRSSESIS